MEVMELTLTEKFSVVTLLMFTLTSVTSPDNDLVVSEKSSKLRSWFKLL